MQSQWTLDPAPAAARPACLAPPSPRGINLAAAVRDACAAWWQALLTRRAGRQAAVALSDLDDHLLRDVGAPGWLLQETQVLREIEQNRLAHWLRT